MALTVSQLASITQELYIPKCVDNIFLSNGTLFRLREKGIKYSGGRDIVQPIVYAKVTAAGAYEGYETLATTPNDVLTAAVFQYRQHYAHIAISGREELLNSGKEAILNLLEAKRMAAEMTLMDNLGTGLQGTNSSGKNIDGLQDALSATSTYGGIAVADFSNWVAQVPTLTTTGTLTLADMQRGYGKATVGSDHPTVCITLQSVFDKFWTLLQPDQRFVDSKMANAGFQSLTFNGIPVIVDSHVSGTAAGGSNDCWMEFLNERYVWLGTHKDANFKVVPIAPTKDQDAKMVRILWAGNLILSRRDVHSVFKTIDPLK